METRSSFMFSSLWSICKWCRLEKILRKGRNLENNKTFRFLIKSLFNSPVAPTANEKYEQPWAKERNPRPNLIKIFQPPICFTIFVPSDSHGFKFWKVGNALWILTNGIFILRSSPVENLHYMPIKLLMSKFTWLNINNSELSIPRSELLEQTSSELVVESHEMLESLNLL